ncbi:sodium:solute symporter [Corynebacterium heidelbergense]|uniref:Sodium:solute symporter n=1 Tax=Corynebacterium heidelbergense TaxID=2055947 RepID=A0A364V6T3_9CORY|nr:sodium:solute symporter [Corynebacterium heidelbergense]RAV32328.1 sodium:solute symporter [Corynebacterium heidelbergense]
MNWLNTVIIVLYLGMMLTFGWWGKRRIANRADYLVAGRRLGPVMYAGTMAAVVLGGASAVGGIGLGYKFGISGLWLVFAIGVGVLVLSLCFAPVLQRLRIYTVTQMLQMRYGGSTTRVASLVMLGYTLMLTVTSTSAYASIFMVLFGWDRWLALLVGGGIVLFYSTTGGMWSITLADMAQIIVMTVAVFFLMLPISLHRAGGWAGMHDRLGQEFFSLNSIGLDAIITYFVIYTLGVLIGQDIWQRVFTARSGRTARWGGAAAGIYCVLFGIAGAVIGTAAAVVLPGISDKDAVYARVSVDILPMGLGGIALAGGLAAMMSTASGGLIAAATVTKEDVIPLLRGERQQPERQGEQQAEDVHGNRFWVFVLGIFTLIVAATVADVIAALTIAYDILVGGLLVAIIGGILWPRATGVGAACSMLAGTVGTLVTMTVLELRAEEKLAGIMANEPIYVGLALSLVVYVVVSLATKPNPEAQQLQYNSPAKAGR